MEGPQEGRGQPTQGRRGASTLHRRRQPRRRPLHRRRPRLGGTIVRSGWSSAPTSDRVRPERRPSARPVPGCGGPDVSAEQRASVLRVPSLPLRAGTADVCRVAPSPRARCYPVRRLTNAGQILIAATPNRRRGEPVSCKDLFHRWPCMMFANGFKSKSRWERRKGTGTGGDGDGGGGGLLMSSRS